jgi:putative ABC transport system permease protein
MTNIAWKNLARERTRLGISVGGVAFAVLLILIVRGLYAGFLDQTTRYIKSVDADVWVAEASTPGDFFHSVSLIPTSRAAELSAVAGVAKVVPLSGRPVVFRHGTKDLDFYLLGIDPVAGTGGPPAMEHGARQLHAGEVIIDRVFASEKGVRIGDVLDVGSGVRLTVVGIARGGNSLVSQFAWATIGDVQRLFGLRDIVNYYLVDVAKNANATLVARQIARDVPSVKAMTEAEFTEKNVADLSESFLPIIWVLAAIAFGIGTAVIALTIYTATLEKRREYGVLKAIGFSNRRLYGVVYRQSLTSAVIGFALGILLTIGIADLIERLLPSFVVTLRGIDVALVAAAVFFMAILASLAPVRPVARLDPAQVFRA